MKAQFHRIRLQNPINGMVLDPSRLPIGPAQSFDKLPVEVGVKARELPVKNCHHVTISYEDVPRGPVIMGEDDAMLRHRPDEISQPFRSRYCAPLASRVRSHQAIVEGRFRVIRPIARIVFPRRRTGPHKQVPSTEPMNVPLI